MLTTTFHLSVNFPFFAIPQMTDSIALDNFDHKYFLTVLRLMSSASASYINKVIGRAGDERNLFAGGGMWELQLDSV